MKGYEGNEEIIRRRMRLAFYTGTKVDSRGAMEDLRQAFADLEISPSPETERLYHELMSFWLTFSAPTITSNAVILLMTP